MGDCQGLAAPPLGTYERPSTEAAEGLRLRAGDQPLPVPNDFPPIADLVIAEIEARRQLGVQRYGTPLQAFNGRDPLQDALDEVLDLAHYLMQLKVERDSAPRAIADPDAPLPAPPQRATRVVRLEGRTAHGRFELADLSRASWVELRQRVGDERELRAKLARMLGFGDDPAAVEITVFDLPDAPVLCLAAAAPEPPHHRTLSTGGRP